MGATSVRVHTRLHWPIGCQHPKIAPMGDLVQNPTDAPPKPRRRRIVVAAAVALLAFASMVSWWYWPRGDARFVGRWRINTVGSPNQAIVSFQRHGRGTTTVPSDVRVVYSWRIEGNRLILGQKVTDRFQAAVNWLTSSWESLTGTAIMLEEESLEVLEVTPDFIRVQSDPGGDVVTLTRIPE